MKAEFLAAIFDLDGTLLDSTHVWNEVDAAFLAKRRIAQPEDYAKQIESMSFEDAARYTVKRFGLAETIEAVQQEWHDMVADKYAHEVPLKPCAKEYLLALKQCGVRLAVATALPRRHYEAVLRNNGVYELFEVFCSADEVGVGKSSPKVFERTAEKLGLAPENCMVFEDILIGVESAKRAGMTAYGVYDPSNAALEAEFRRVGDGYLRSFREAPLPHLLTD